jgi:excisionase family DNA binding protein
MTDENTNNAGNAAIQLALTPREAASALSISERTLWALSQSGEIPRIKIGRSVRYRVETLREWLAQQERQVTK